MPLEERFETTSSPVCAWFYIPKEPISSNFSSSTQTPIQLGHSALSHPIPTLGERALLSAARQYRQ